MSRTSSERSHASRERHDRRDVAFRTAFTATVITLSALCLVFLAIGFLQGPKLSEAQVDPGLAIAQSGQQLRLFANQQVAEVDPANVIITPAAPFTVTTSGDLIVVQFESRLHYDTRYVVAVGGVTSISGGTAATLQFAFDTGFRPVLVLDRSAEGDDEVVSTSLIGGERGVVYSAPRIQSFVSLGQSLVIVTALDDGTSEISLVSLVNGTEERLPLPEPGTIGNLDLLPNTSTVGFTFTSVGAESLRTFDDTLFTIDLEASRALEPVVGLDGAPLTVLAWHPMPQGANLIAQARDQSVFLITPGDPAATVPLGSYTALGRVTSDGTRMSVTDPFGAMVVSLDDLGEERVAPSPVDGEVAYGGDLHVLADGTRVQQVAILDTATGRFSTLLVHDNGVESRILLRTVDDEGSIEGFIVSPNDQFVAVEVLPRVAGSSTDGNPVDPRPLSMTTVFVEISTGSVVGTVQGFSPRW